MIPTLHKPEHLTGIVEADETFFLESHKGEKELSRPPRKRAGKAAKRGIFSEQVSVLIVRDRSGITSEEILPGVTADALTEVLTSLLDSDAILCSDGHRSYQAFSKKSGISHRPVNLSAGNRVIDKAFYVQNVNAYNSRLKEWMLGFHRVASKYLDHYLRDENSIIPEPDLSFDSTAASEQQLRSPLCACNSNTAVKPKSYVILSGIIKSSSLSWQRWLDSHTKVMNPQQFLLEVAGANGIYQQLMQT